MHDHLIEKKLVLLQSIEFLFIQLISYMYSDCKLHMHFLMSLGTKKVKSYPEKAYNFILFYFLDFRLYPVKVYPQRLKPRLLPCTPRTAKYLTIKRATYTSPSTT